MTDIVYSIDSNSEDASKILTILLYINLNVFYQPYKVRALFFI